MATAVMLVVSAASLTLLSTYQRSYEATVGGSELRAGLRSAADLLVQEVGQAGLLSFTPVSLSMGVTGNAVPQAVSISSTTGVFVGEQLVIDQGAAQESVMVMAVTSSTITGTFTRSHASGARVTAVGVFPQGVLSTSSSSRLELLGDINSDGTIVYARYDCDLTSGILSRSLTPITASSRNPSLVLVDNVVANPGGTPCFRYITTTAGGFTFVTSVSVTLTARSAQVDAWTGQPRIETKTFRAVTPRNVVLGLTFANAGVTDHLQPTPPGVPLS